jgi:NAD/NADP transhydrogenase beta subunit
MFGNKSYSGGFGGGDKAKDKGDEKKDQKFKDFSAEDKADLVQTKNDTVIIHPQAKDLVEKVIRTLKKGA